MAGKRPPKPPSALDGYRRLERTRSVRGVDAAAVVGAAVVTTRDRRVPRLTRARIAGAMRLVAFVAVLALIVGTSVGLASADERSAAVRAKAPVAKSTIEKTSTKKTSTSEVAREDHSAHEAATAEPAVSTGTATGAVPQATLPFTGADDHLSRILLGGALLMLVGMLVQIAGQPLPARAHVRN